MMKFLLNEIFSRLKWMGPLVQMSWKVMGHISEIIGQ